MLINPFCTRSSCASWVLAALALLVGNGRLLASDPTYVGVLAIAIEKDAAEKIGLSDEVRAKLQDLVTARESEGLELAIELKEAPADEKAAKMAVFAADSEKQGLELLSDEEKAKLEQLRIGRTGMLTLAEVPIAAKIGLSAEQKEQVAELVKKRAEGIAAAGESKRLTTEQYYEKQFYKILTDSQKAKWDALAGVQPAAPKAESEVGAEGSVPPMTAGSTPAGSTPGSPRSDGPGSSRGGSERGQFGAGSSRGGTPGSSRGGSGSETTRPDAPKAEPIARSTIKPSPDGKVRFNFRYAPWNHVLDWFAGTADLSLEMTTVPPGTFNYTDSRAYTPAEAIDLLNGVLLTKGYTLVRRERMLMVVNLEEGTEVLRGLAPQIKAEDLDKYGDFELVGCLFQLHKYTPEDAEADIKKFIGPQGSILIMPKAKQIYVSETAGKLRTIRRIIEGVENPDAGLSDQLVEVTLQHASTEEVLVTVRELMGISEGRNSLPDNSLRMAVDALAGRLILSGKPEKIAMAQKIIKIADVSANLEGGGPVVAIETPQLQIYKITSADPAAVLRVLQTLLADTTDVRLEVNPKTGDLVALARPSQHATIKATLEEMQRDPMREEVIPLRRLDVALAVLSLNKIFNAGEGGDPQAPKIDGEPTTRNLIVRGSADQISRIKTLLEKMGEGDSPLATANAANPSNVRLVPLTGSAAERALQQMQAVWPTVQSNRIRVVMPSTSSGGPRPRETSVHPTDPIDDLIEQYVPTEQPKTPAPVKTPEAAAPTKPLPLETKATEHRARGIPLQFAMYQQLAAEADKSSAPVVESAPTSPETETPKAPVEKKPSKPGAEIVVTMGPNGIVIASEDTEALDEFETLLHALMDRMPANGGQDFTVFYLKYAKAEVAAALLAETIGASSGSTSSDSGGGGGGLMGSMMNAALGDAGGGLLGGLFGLDGGGGSTTSSAPAISTSGKVSVISDPRLNALYVHAGPADIDLVEQLLKVIDQEYAPMPTQTQPLPRMIPVKYAVAEDVARQVREIFAARMAAQANQGGQQRQPTPQEFMEALRGGGGRGGRGGGGRAGGQQGQRGEETKMTISVDARSNSLVVAAPEPLFQEVKAMVEQLDQAGAEAGETTQVLTLKKANPEVIQRGLQSLLGPNVKTNVTAASNTPQAQSGFTQNNNRGGNTSRTQGGQRGGQGGQQPNFLQMLQQGGGGGGFGGGGFGGQGNRGQGGRGGQTQGGRGGR